MSQKSKGLLVAGAFVGEQARSGGHVMAGAEDPGSQAAACRSCSADWEAVQTIANACGQLQSLCGVSVTQVLAASEAFSLAPPCCYAYCCVTDALPPQRAEVQSLWHRLREVAELRENQARELAQQVESLQRLHHSVEVEEQLLAMEAHLGVLQTEARRLDSLGPALSTISKYARSKQDCDCASSAARAVEAFSLPELTELWMEIETLATKHACEPTSTAETKDVSIQTESCDTGDEQASVIGTVVAGGLGEEVKLIPDRMLGLATATDEDKDIHAHAWNGTTEGTVVAGVSISTKQEAPSAASLSPAAAFRAQRCAGAEGVDTRGLDRQMQDLTNTHLQRIQGMQMVQDQLEAAARLGQEKMLALEAQVQKLQAELQISNSDLQKAEEQRDVIADEHAVLSEVLAEMHDKVQQHERGSLEVLPFSEEASVRTESNLDRSEFDTVVSQTQEFLSWVLQQGPSVGFGEMDVKEIRGLDADLAESCNVVEDTASMLLTDWQRIRDGQQESLLKRRHRVLHTVVGRLDGSTAPRHNVRKLKTAINQFLAAQAPSLDYGGGRLERESQESAPQLSHPGSYVSLSKKAPTPKKGGSNKTQPRAADIFTATKIANDNEAPLLTSPKSGVSAFRAISTHANPERLSSQSRSKHEKTHESRQRAYSVRSEWAPTDPASPARMVEWMLNGRARVRSKQDRPDSRWPHTNCETPAAKGTVRGRVGNCASYLR